MTENVSFNPNVGLKAPEMVEIKTKNGTFKVDSSIFGGMNVAEGKIGFDGITLKNGVSVLLNDQKISPDDKRKSGDAIISISNSGNMKIENANSVVVNSRNGIADDFNIWAKDSQVLLASDYDQISTFSEGKSMFKFVNLAPNAVTPNNTPTATSVYKEPTEKCSDEDIAKTEPQPQHDEPTPCEKLIDDPGSLVVDDDPVPVDIGDEILDPTNLIVAD